MSVSKHWCKKTFELLLEIIANTIAYSCTPIKQQGKQCGKHAFILEQIRHIILNKTERLQNKIIIKIALKISLMFLLSVTRQNHSLLISFHSFMFWGSICWIWVTFQHWGGWPHVTHLSANVRSAQFNSVKHEHKRHLHLRANTWDGKINFHWGYAEHVCVGKESLLKRREVCERMRVFTFGAETQNLTPSKSSVLSLDIDHIQLSL